MSARLTILLAAVIAAMLVAAGCGDDDDGSDGGSADISVTTSSITKPQFVKKATEVCEEERTKIPTRSAAYERTAPDKQSPAEAYTGGVKAVILPTFQAEVTKITKLGAPAGQEERVEAILEAEQAAIDEVSEMETIRTIDDVVVHFGDSNKLLREYGLTNCLVVAEPKPSG